MFKKCYQLYRQYEEIIRYLVVGGLTTVVSLSTYYVCVFFFLDPNKPLELQTANIISWIFAVIFAYGANRIFVFKSKNTNKWKEVIEFISSRLTTLFIDMGIMFCLVTLWKWNDTIVKIIVQFVVIITNYIFSKYLVFKPQKQHPVDLSSKE